MRYGKFFYALTSLTVALLVVTFGFFSVGMLHDSIDFTLYCIAAFVVLSVLIYYLGNNAAGSSNKYAFNNLIILNMVIKMLVSVLLILWYKSTTQIQSRSFLISFLIIYLVYTTFETYVLMRLAKQN